MIRQDCDKEYQIVIGERLDRGNDVDAFHVGKHYLEVSNSRYLLARVTVQVENGLSEPVKRAIRRFVEDCLEAGRVKKDGE